MKKYRNVFIVAAALVALLLLSAFLGLTIKQDQMIHNYIHLSAESFFDSIVVARRWNANYGGVFVKKTPQVQSNPYLEHPDITTEDGFIYTMKNPALMTREISEMAKNSSGYQYHITSTRLLNPNNQPDEWEKKALASFENGVSEATVVDEIGGKKVYRLMRPLAVEQGCLTCHGKQGYKVGDVRGGISVALPYDEIYTQLQSNRLKMFGLGASVITLFSLILYFIIWKLFSHMAFLNDQLKEKQNLLIKINQDLDRKVAERTNELATANQELRSEITERIEMGKALSKLATALEQVADEVFITDSMGVITYANPAVESISGYSPKELIGKKPSIFKSGKQNSTFYEDLWNTIASGKPWSGRFYNKTREGREIIQDASIAPILDADRHIVGYVSVRHDVTQHIEMEHHVTQAQKLEAIGTLAGGIAHDFNNILAAIVGYVDLALLKNNDEDIKEDLEAVQKAAGRAADLVKQILAFSRMSQDEAKPIQVKPIVNEAMKLLRASIPVTIDIVQRLTSNSLVMADPGEIHRILVNLCTNSALSMRDTGGLLEIGLDDVELDAVFLSNHHGVAPGKYLRLSVKDTGCGMPLEVKQRIFEPFFTTRGDAGGTGMGLAVVHGIVVTRGGTISVTSEEGYGTTIEVFLPVLTEKEHVYAQENEKPIKGTEHVLFVDDEQMVVDLAKKTLELFGYKVSTFTRSLQALEAFKDKPDYYDIVVTDMTMPKMTGDALAAKIREIRPEMPIIICTGYSDKIYNEKPETLGVNEMASKPLAISQLTRIIRRILDNK